MKHLILSLAICATFFASCSRSEFELPQPATARPELNPSTATGNYFRFKLNGQWLTADSVKTTRNAARQTLSITAHAGDFVISIRVNHIVQTGNSTGLILAGLYELLLEEKKPEGRQSYITVSKTLWIYSDQPLTSPQVTGRFAFDAQAADGGAGIRISDGEFKAGF